MATIIEAKQQYWGELSDVAGALVANFTKILRSPGKFNGNAVDGGRLWGTEYTITVNSELSVRDDWARLEPIDSYLAQNLLVNLAAEFPEFGNIKDWRELTRDNITEEMVNKLSLVARRRFFWEYCDVSRSLQEADPVKTYAWNSLDTQKIVKLFLDYKRPGRSPTYLNRIEGKLRIFAKHFPKLPVRPEPIEAYLSRFSNETATGQDAWKVLSMFYKFAESRFGLANPMKDICKPRYKKKPGERLSQDQARSFLKAIITVLDWALVTCYFGLRLRRSEAQRLRFGDIKEDYIVVHGKERTEELPLLPTFRNMLLKLRNGRGPDEAVFSGENGPLHSDTLALHIEKLFKRSGIEGVRGSPHTLRNTAGRLWLVYGGDQGSNRQLLRHSTQTMTDHYSELSMEELMLKERKHNPMLNLMKELGHEVPEWLPSGPFEPPIQNTSSR